jgi:hypothetical protein
MRGMFCGTADIRTFAESFCHTGLLRVASATCLAPKPHLLTIAALRQKFDSIHRSDFSQWPGMVGVALQ